MIVVTTPTGQIGSQVLERLLAADAAVRVIVRDPAGLDPQVRGRVEVVVGSHADAGVVDEAFAGADTLFWLLPPNPRADDVTGYYLTFARPACAAIVDRGVQRVVSVSTLGHGTEGAGQLSAALAVDELMADTGVSRRVLKMPYFMENLLGQVDMIRDQGMFAMPNVGDRTLLTVATSDIAAAAAPLLLDGSWSGQDDVPVVGPDDLSPEGMAAVMADVLDRPVRFRHVPGEDFVPALTGRGVGAAWAQALVEMADAQGAGFYGDPPRTAPTGFRRWCTDVLAPAVRA